MCEALMEIMEPQLLKREREGKQEERKEATRVAVEAFRDTGQKDTEIKKILIRKFGLTAEEADEYLREEA